jgi:ligand-binding sensor domain-containing protein
MRYFFLIILICSLFAGLAQTTGNIAAYTVRNGLSNNTINKIIRDSRGFLWIATAEGLNRFDGTRFVSFFSDAADGNTLSGNNVIDLLEYAPGQLLIATNNGLCVLNTFNNSFENNKIRLPALRKGSGTYIRSLFMDHRARVYINHSGEIDVFDSTLNFLYRLTDQPWAASLKGIIVYIESWVQDSEGRIWLPSDNYGICILDEKKRQVYSSANNPFHYSFFGKGSLRSFYYDEPDKTIWFSTWGNGVTRYELQTGRSHTLYFDLPYNNESRTINAITKYNDRIVCCGSKGVYSIDKRTLQYENIYGHSTNTDAGSFINSHTLLNDSENLWIGSETKGMVQLSLAPSPVQQIKLPFPVVDYTNFATGIVQSNNGLIYFAYGTDGLVELDPVTRKTNRYRLSADANSAPLIYRICEDGRNRLWIGTNTGMLTFDKNTKQFLRAAWLPPFAERLSVTYLFRDSNGNVWMSFTQPNSLGYYETATDQFHYYENYRDGQQKFFDDRLWITRMTEDEQGNVWMISYQGAGILCYEATSKQWKKYPASARSAKILGTEGLNSICATGQSLWIGSISGLGLIRYDYATDTIQHFSRKAGLLSENILAISKDRDNNLFLATKAGINYINIRTQEIRSLIVNNQDIEWAYAFIQTYDSAHQQLIYGLNDRIVMLQNNAWQTQKTAIKTYIDHIKVNNSFYPFDHDRPLRLQYFQGNISFDFTSINFDRNASSWYAYKMEGLDKDWNLNQQQTTANYSNLSPGHYTFMVRAKDRSGVWGPLTTIPIDITPAFWKTYWFWALTGSLLILLTVIWERRRITGIRKSAGLQLKLSEAEMLALRAQMNPHFIFNCLSAIDNLIQTNQPDKATTYLARFAKLMRSVLESSKNNLVPFHKDFEMLQLFLQLEQFRSSDKFSYQLEADEELLQGDYKVPPLIVQPFVENAIHHGLLNKPEDDKRLFIKASLHGSFIRYTVRDNGVGRMRAAEIKQLNKPEHNSYGIQITTERIHLHNQHGNTSDVNIRDLEEGGVPAGTEVTVQLAIDH